MKSRPASARSLSGRVLTAPGVGAIAVIRVRGANAHETLSQLLEPHRRLRPGRLCYGQLVHQGRPIDEAILASKTLPDGTEEVDVNVHGGVRVVQRLLVALQSLGVRIDSPGVVGRDDWPAEHLIDVDAYNALANASTRRAVEFILNQRVVLSAHLFELCELAKKRPQLAKDRLSQLADSSRPGRIMTQGASIAILGPPNAGKSTLANRLLGRTMSLVADRPGVTRDWVAQPTALEGIPVTLIDTAGIGQPDNPDQAQAMLRGMQRCIRADLHLLVLDGADAWPADFVDRVDPTLDRDHLRVVVNKSDRPRRWGLTRLPPAWQNLAGDLSAILGDGLDQLRAAIVADLVPPNLDPGQPCLFADRQRQCVRRILADQGSSTAELSSRIRRDLLGRGLNRESG